MKIAYNKKIQLKAYITLVFVWTINKEVRNPKDALGLKDGEKVVKRRKWGMRSLIDILCSLKNFRPFRNIESWFSLGSEEQSSGSGNGGMPSRSKRNSVLHYYTLYMRNISIKFICFSLGSHTYVKWKLIGRELWNIL